MVSDLKFNHVEINYEWALYRSFKGLIFSKLCYFSHLSISDIESFSNHSKSSSEKLNTVRNSIKNF